jgi:hypothetical protein
VTHAGFSVVRLLCSVAVGLRTARHSACHGSLVAHVASGGLLSSRTALSKCHFRSGAHGPRVVAHQAVSRFDGEHTGPTDLKGPSNSGRTTFLRFSMKSVFNVIAKLGVGQISPAEVCVSQVSAAQIETTKVCSAQASAVEVCAGEPSHHGAVAQC